MGCIQVFIDTETASEIISKFVEIADHRKFIICATQRISDIIHRWLNYKDRKLPLSTFAAEPDFEIISSCGEMTPFEYLKSLVDKSTSIDDVNDYGISSIRIYKKIRFGV